MIGTGLDIHSYYLFEILISLVLVGVAVLSLGLVALCGMLVFWVTTKVANWTVPASRNVIALSRRLLTAYARS